MVIWITGLSGAGKTTLANKLGEHYRTIGRAVLQIDGDKMRNILDQRTSYDRASRLKISRIYSKLAQNASSQGLLVIVSVIGLFEETFEWNRQNLPLYYEIFMDTPMEELERRNSKKLYGRESISKSIVGVDLEMDYPSNADMHLVFDPSKTVEQVAEHCIRSFDDFCK